MKKLDQKISQLENYLADVVYDRAEGKLANLLQAVLFFLSYVFEAIVLLRFFLYNKRVLRNQPLGCLVVVVGNLTVGGTGKTPVVERFARSLTERGRSVAVLSRGYKSKKEPAYKRILRWFTHQEAPPPKVVSDGETVFLKSDVAGDEPYMLAKNLPGVAVVVDKNRVKAGEYAISEFGADTLVLDDGFQYLPLRGQLNLLLIDRSNPFGNGRLLPRGILREPIRHVRRASYIFLTKSKGEDHSELYATIRKYNKEAEIIECCHKPQFFKEVNRPGKFSLEDIAGKKVLALSAIANPIGFEDFITDLGGEIVERRRFIDHHRFTDWQIQEVFEAAKKAGAEYVVTTEKDAVRIEEDFEAPLPFYYLRMEIGILSGEDNFDKAVARICFKN